MGGRKTPILVYLQVCPYNGMLYEHRVEKAQNSTAALLMLYSMSARKPHKFEPDGFLGLVRVADMDDGAVP